MNVSGIVSFGEESPLVSVDSAGNATTVWQRYRGGKLIYESAVRQAGGPWSTPSRFFGGLEDAYELQIAVNPLGNQTAVWVGRGPPISRRTKGLGEPQIAVDPQGRSTIIWAIGAQGGTVIQSANSVRR